MCFICTLQVFHVDVAKVDQDVAYVVMVIHVCCKCLFQMFQLFQTYGTCVFIWVLHMFHTYVVSVSSECCICFTYMLQMFHLDVAYVLQWLHTYFFSCFWRMLQVFQLFRTYVANVSSRCCKSRSGVSHVTMGPICSSCWARVGVEGHERQARDTEWCGPPREVGTGVRADTAACLHETGVGVRMLAPVQTLAFPKLLWCTRWKLWTCWEQPAVAVLSNDRLFIQFLGGINWNN
jgi:hypothetical protein